MLGLKHALLQHFRCVAVHNGDFFLQDYFPCVDAFIHVVHRRAGLCVAGREDCFMDFQPVHSLAAVFRYKGRVYIYYPAAVLLDDPWIQDAHVAGKYDQVCFRFCQRLKDGVCFCVNIGIVFC